VVSIAEPIVWRSSNSDVLSIGSDGAITAVGIGSATIKATYKTLSDSATITVDIYWSGIVTSGYHSCGWALDGTGFCWGDNQKGQLGTTAANGPVKRPQRIDTNIRFAMLTMGVGFTCGLALDEQVYCWGANHVGQLADGTRTDRSLPRAIASTVHFTTITSGWEHTCGVAESGQAYCWGSDHAGQLGRGGNVHSDGFAAVPTVVAGTSSFRLIDAGVAHTCGLTPDGAAYCWGWNELGQLGIGATSFATSSPSPVMTSDPFSAIAAAYFHSCGLRQDGSAECWGSWYLGDGAQTRSATVPKPVNGARQYSGLSTLWQHTCAWLQTGEVYCWGRDAEGANGNGISDLTSISEGPSRVLTQQNFERVSAGFLTTCGVTTSGDAFCWGYNSAGQLGNGSTASAATPVRVSDPVP
jgi:alpha-tubulin suppressor-like RCC1 family protein